MSIPAIGNSRSDLPAAQALMIGLLLRGHFSNLDREFLDRLAPTRSITFVLQSEAWLHPKDVSLFDPTTLRSIRQFHPTAIFSHLCPPVPGSMQRHKITSGIINPGDEQPLLVGLLGPDHEISGADRENEFVETVATLRQAYRDASRTVAKLTGRCKSDDPVIVVNRASGRIIHVGDGAATLCGCTAEEMIDREFHDIRSFLPGLKPGMKLALETVTDGDISLGLLRIDGVTGQTTRNDERARFLFRQSETALGVLRHSGSQQNDDAIVDPVGLLAHCVGSLKQSLITPERAPSGRSNLLICLDGAIQEITGKNRTDYAFRIRTAGDNFTIGCDPDTVIRLINCVLLAHLDRNGRPHETELALEIGEHPTLTITTTAAANMGSLALNDAWLAEIDGYRNVAEAVHSSSPGGVRIKSQITFKE